MAINRRCAFKLCVLGFWQREEFAKMLWLVLLLSKIAFVNTVGAPRGEVANCWVLSRLVGGVGGVQVTL